MRESSITRALQRTAAAEQSDGSKNFQGTQVLQKLGLPYVSSLRDRAQTRSGFLAKLVAPTRRAALEREDITTLNKLSKYSELERLQSHGMGPNTIPTLKKALKVSGLTFKTTVSA